MSRRKRVQDRMQQLHITYSQIAQHVMLSARVIKDWVEGKVNIPYTYVWKICELLNLECDDVVEVV